MKECGNTRYPHERYNDKNISVVVLFRCDFDKNISVVVLFRCDLVSFLNIDNFRSYENCYGLS
jgi:hypothetical protein